MSQHKTTEMYQQKKKDCKYSSPRLLSPPQDQMILAYLAGGCIYWGTNFHHSHVHK